ncbi:hypothetical protein AAE478_004494 [Parahypoxylon ruwenzoriense]
MEPETLPHVQENPPRNSLISESGGDEAPLDDSSSAQTARLTSSTNPINLLENQLSATGTASSSGGQEIKQSDAVSRGTASPVYRHPYIESPLFDGSDQELDPGALAQESVRDNQIWTSADNQGETSKTGNETPVQTNLLPGDIVNNTLEQRSLEGTTRSALSTPSGNEDHAGWKSKQKEKERPGGLTTPKQDDKTNESASRVSDFDEFGSSEPSSPRSYQMDEPPGDFEYDEYAPRQHHYNSPYEVPHPPTHRVYTPPPRAPVSPSPSLASIPSRYVNLDSTSSIDPTRTTGQYSNPFKASKEEITAMFEDRFGPNTPARRTRQILLPQLGTPQLPQREPNYSYTRQSPQPQHKVYDAPSYYYHGSYEAINELPHSIPSMHTQTPDTGQDSNQQLPIHPLATPDYDQQWQQNDRTQHRLDANLIGTTQPPHEQLDHSSDSRAIIRVPLQPSFDRNGDHPTGPHSHLWTQPKVQMENGGQTELLIISSIEHYYNASSENMAVITQSDSAALPSSENMNPQINYWLNVQQETLSLSSLRDIVIDCPYIRDEALSVTIQLLFDQEAQASKPSSDDDSTELGTVIRYDGHRNINDNVETVTSVTFITAPYLIVKERREGHLAHDGKEYLAKTLIQTLYHYEPEDQIAGFSEPTVYETPFDIIITMSQLPLAELAGRRVEIEVGLLDYRKKIRTVFFRYGNGVEKRKEIRCDCEYIDLVYLACQIIDRDSLADAAEVASRLEDHTGALLTAEKWKILLSLSDNQEIALQIRPRQKSADSNPPSPVLAPSSNGGDGSILRIHPDTPTSSIRSQSVRSIHSFSSLIRFDSPSTYEGTNNEDYTDSGAIAIDDNLFSYGTQNVVSLIGSAQSELPILSTAEDSLTASILILEASSPVDSNSDGSKNSGNTSHTQGNSTTTDANKGRINSTPLLSDGDQQNTSPNTTRDKEEHIFTSMPQEDDTTITITNLRNRIRPRPKDPVYIANNYGIGRHFTSSSGSINSSPIGSKSDLTTRSQSRFYHGSSDDDTDDYSAEDNDIDNDDNHEAGKATRGRKSLDSENTRRPRDQTPSVEPHMVPKPIPRGEGATTSSSISYQTTATSKHNPERSQSASRPPPPAGNSPSKRDTGAQIPRRRSSRSLSRGFALLNRRQRNSVETSPNKSEIKSEHIPDFNPFFTWVQRKNTDREEENPKRKVSRILAKTHKSLVSRVAVDNISSIYSKTDPCTANDFIHRHLKITHEGQPSDTRTTTDRSVEATPTKAKEDGLHPMEVPSPIESPKSSKRRVVFSRDSPSRISTTDILRSSRFTTFTRNSSSTTAEAIVRGGLALGFMSPQPLTNYSNDNSSTPLTTRNHLHDMQAQIGDLFIASTKFVNLFVPGDTCGNELVIKKLWGSIEQIARQAELSFALVNPGQVEAWSIRSLSSPGLLQVTPSRQDSWVECDRCKTAERDPTLLEALKHCHFHLGPEEHESLYKPHEDPCVVWLQAHHNLRHDRWRDLIQPRIKSLILAVTQLQDKALEIGNRCARPTASGKAGSDLPRNLVFAFEAIIALYCIAADSIARVNYNATDTILEPTYPSAISTISEEPSMWSNDFGYYEARASNLLHEALQDTIMLELTDKKPERVDLEPVGREFLIGIIFSNLHGLRLEATNNVDTVAPYKKHASRLQYLVHNRPKKRLFIELTALERELKALHKVFNRQIEILQKITEVTDPRTVKETKERRDQYDLECEYMKGVEDKLYYTINQIDQLQQKVAHLKIQVVQLLEVLEEGHGKAIRVFTLVTLFFLPMSFVTSFFGMNTSDIRDMDNKSTFFWLIALPSTAGIVAVAFLYAYHWDDVREYFSRLRVRRRAARETLRASSSLPDSLPTHNKRLVTTRPNVGRTFRELRGAVRRRASTALKKEEDR